MEGKRKKSEVNDETGSRLFVDSLLHQNSATTRTRTHTRPVRTHIFYTIPHLCRPDGYFSPSTHCCYLFVRWGKESPVGWKRQRIHPVRMFLRKKSFLFRLLHFQWIPNDNRSVDQSTIINKIKTKFLNELRNKTPISRSDSQNTYN